MQLTSGRGLLAQSYLREQCRDYERTLAGLAKGTEAYAQAAEDFHQRGAERLFKLALANRGLYAKAAQIVATLSRGYGDGVIPRSYADRAAMPYGRASHVELAEVAALLREAGIFRHSRASVTASADEVAVEEPLGVRSVEPEPLFSTPLAQVHSAILHDGAAVAVKVQRPRAAEEVETDVADLRRVASQLRSAYDFDTGWAVDELERVADLELDFEVEAENAELTSQLLAHRAPCVWVPVALRQLSSRRVLTTELPGDLLSAADPGALLAAGLRPEECAEIVADVFAEMVFLHGRVSANLNDQSVFFRNASAGTRRAPKPQLVLMDHGLYYELGTRENSKRSDLCRLWKACCFQDVVSMQSIGERLVGAGAPNLLPMLLSPWFSCEHGGLSAQDLCVCLCPRVRCGGCC